MIFQIVIIILIRIARILNVLIDQLTIIRLPCYFKSGSYPFLSMLLLGLCFAGWLVDFESAPRLVEIWKFVLQVSGIGWVFDVKNYVFHVRLPAVIVWACSDRLRPWLRRDSYFLSCDWFIVPALKLLFQSCNLKLIIIIFILLWGSQVCNSFLNCNIWGLSIALKLRFRPWGHCDFLCFLIHVRKDLTIT